MLSDLDEAKEEVKRQALEEAKGLVKHDVQSAKEQLKDEIGPQVRSAAELAEGASAKAQSAAETASALGADVGGLRDGLQELKHKLRTEMQNGDAQVRQHVADELQQMGAKFDEQLLKLATRMEGMVAERASGAVGEATARLRADLEATAAGLRQETAAACAEVREELGGTLTAEVAGIKAKNAQQDKELESTKKRLMADISAQEESLRSQTQRLEESSKRAMAEAQGSLETASREATERLRVLDEQTEKALKACYSLISDVENVPTKRLDWVIRGASQRLKPPPPSPEEVPGDEPPFGSWKSPKFDAAGARDLQLELRVYRPVNPPAPGQERGDCAVFLTAPRGTNLACRLLVGTASQSFEKRFASDRDVLGTGRLCFLEEQVDQVANKLSVSVEVLESICELERPAAPKPGSEEEAEAAAAALVAEANGEEPLNAAFVLHRHINNRVLQQVRSQVDHFKSRTVRRVEWRLEEASRMRRCFPRGTPMRSRVFDAAGLEGLQLVFYPSGYDGASEGFCSLFLSAPGGASVRCSLQAGPERRELSQTWEHEGQFGRTNFCRFETCVDPDDDTVLVVLDIDDATQDIATRFGHFPPPAAGIRSLAEESPAPAPIGSVMKLHRGPVRVPPELQEVKVLPAITAGRNRHDPAAKLYSSGSCGALRDPGWRRKKPLV